MITLQEKLPLPAGIYALYGSSVRAGFPSPADDFVERGLDLNDFLVSHPAATFFARVQGQAMVQEGIYEGDYLVVDRSLTPSAQQLVLAVTDMGEITLKRFASLKKAPLEIWGVVTSVIRKV